MFSHLTSKYLCLSDRGTQRTLRCACSKGNISLVELLLPLYREFNQDADDSSALETAVRSGHISIVKLLVSEGWTVSDNILDCCIDYSSRGRILEYLLTVREVSSEWVTQAIVACSCEKNEECCAVLVDRTWHLISEEDREEILLIVVDQEFYSQLLPKYNMTLERAEMLHRLNRLLCTGSGDGGLEILSLLSKITPEDRRLVLTFSVREDECEDFDLVLEQVGLVGVDAKKLISSISCANKMLALLEYPTFRVEDLDEEGWTHLVDVMNDDESYCSKFDTLADEESITPEDMALGSGPLCVLFRKLLFQQTRREEILSLCAATDDEQLLLALRCTSSDVTCNPELIPLREFFSFLLNWNDHGLFDNEQTLSSIRLGWRMSSSRYEKSSDSSVGSSEED